MALHMNRRECIDYEDQASICQAATYVRRERTSIF